MNNPYLALVDLSQALARGGDGLAVRQERGELATALKKWDLAVVDYTEVVKRKPKDAASHQALGMALFNQGKRAEAVGPLRRAVALEPRNALYQDSLAQAFLALGRYREARNVLPKDSPQLDGILAQIGHALLAQKQWARAEPFLRECLLIRAKQQPEGWLTFNAQSMLGGALLGQKKYAEAKPLLVKGYQGMKEREETIPPKWKVLRLTEAVQRLVQLYEATGKKDEAARWHAELRKLAPPGKPDKKP
jgi:tetratricopeptide (TPR) repeat protein